MVNVKVSKPQKEPGVNHRLLTTQNHPHVSYWTETIVCEGKINAVQNHGPLI